MVCLRWLMVAVMAYVCVPGFGASGCWDSSVCNNLRNKGRLLDCVHLCMSVIQTEGPELRDVTSRVDDDDDRGEVEDGGDDDDDDDARTDLLLNVILASLASGERTDLRPHGNQRRAYSMEHFRWGKPTGDKSQEPRLRAHNNDRRSYSMGHFRWGKPTGRKRRPVKVFTSSMEGGGSTEVGGSPPQARRQLSGGEDEAQRLLRAVVNAKSEVPLSLPQRKDGTYRMSHFRWGSPPASKRNGSLMKTWEEKPQGQLAKFFRNIIVKDVQRIMA